MKRGLQRGGIVLAALFVLVRLAPDVAAQAVALFQGVVLGTASSQTGFLDLYSAGAAHRTRIQAADTPTAAVVWKMPAADLGATGFLQTNGSGVLSVLAASSVATLPIIDNVALLKDDGDPTKLAQFDLSLIPTGTSRQYKLPNVNGDTFAMLGTAQTFTGQQTFNAGAGNDSVRLAAESPFAFGGSTSNALFQSAAQTPDGGALVTGSLSNAWLIAERADVAGLFDYNNLLCAGAACTDPTVMIASGVTNTTAYYAFSNWGTAKRYTKTLTESAATTTLRIPVAAEVGTGGMFFYTIYATDGATPQVRQGRVIFSVTADGATETCVLGTPEETDNTPTGTLTVTVTCDVTPSNAVDLSLNAVSSLTQTTLQAYVSVDLIGPGQPARQ